MSTEDAVNAVNITGHPERKREHQEDGMNNRNKKEKEVSISTENADLISFSPSLAHILSLLDYKDVFYCKLVNRRFNHVIESHHQKMASHWIDVNIVKCIDFDTNQPYILMVIFRRRQHTMSILIGGRLIRVIFGRSHALYNAFPDTIDDLGINSLEEGLGIVLEPLCYHFELTLRINQSVPTEWYPIISDIIKRQGTYLQYLVTPDWPALGTHLRNIDAIEMNWSSNLFNYLPRMSHMSFAHLFLPDPTNVAAQDEILQWFTGWLTGELRMPNVHFEEMGEARWLYQVPPYLVALYGHNCHHRTVPYDEDEELSVDNELFIRRAMDNVTLCIAYRDLAARVYFYETVVTDQEFESMRFDYTRVDP